MDLIYGRLTLPAGSAPARETFLPPDGDHVRRFEGLLLGQRRTVCNVDQATEIHESGDCVVSLVGEITNLALLRSRLHAPVATDAEVVAGMYRQRGRAVMEDLEGQYTIVVHDTADGSVMVFQDRHSSPYTLYWLVHHGALCFGTSMKRLLPLSGISREMDPEALADFMVHGFVPGRRTLLASVSKLVPGEYLRGSSRAPTQVKVGSRSRHPERVALPVDEGDDLAALYRSTVEGALARRITPIRDEALHLVLTSGFDSSLNLRLARDLHPGPIHVHCVGTESGDLHPGEHGRARRIASCYPDVHYHQVLLPENAILDLPDVVWRMEGTCWERGLMLRNRLARAVSGQTSHLIGGDIANQVLNMYLHDHLDLPWRAILGSRLRRLRSQALHPTRFWNRAWRRHPLYWEFDPTPLGLYMNIKQNGQILSSRDVHLKYPFLDGEFVGLASSLIHARGTSVIQLHRSLVRRLVPDDVRRILEKPKIAPILESYCYRDGQRRERATERLRRSPVISDMVPRTLLERVLQGFLRLQSDPHVSIVNRLLYLDLFHGFFVTGDHDHGFGNASLDGPDERFLH